MVDFQSRDTSRGYGDDEDEEGDDAEGDDADEDAGERGDETEPVEESAEGVEEADAEAAGEDPPEPEGGAAGASGGGATAEGAEPGAADDPLAASSGDESGDPLAPDTSGSDAESGVDEGSGPTDDESGPQTDDTRDPSDDDTGDEAPGGDAGADSTADDPLAPSGEPEHGDEGQDTADDHPFADADSADAVPGTDAGETADPSSSGPAREGGDHAESGARSTDSSGHPQDTADHSEGPGHQEGVDTPENAHHSDGAPEHAHGSGGHSHGSGADSHDSGGHSHDHAHGADVGLLGVAVVTVSSTRTREDDTSGDVIEAVVEAADHEVVTREILRDDLDGVQTALLNLTGRDDVDVVVTTGGTGVTPDDVTVEAARPLFDRELPGFGELFRILSYEEIGTRAMVSRATAGMVDGVPVFCLPGSEAAARLGTEELVVEEMAHLVSLARRDD
ncbi:molybdenum cofactor synthesis domain-containing protein [Halosimplex halobium]|uniref:MogA/MoaB family molybdenum cofactor biosynthesis protein n=1 Tax=Halosimplex halobium TaxID=3396618 RepID=UPI003F54F771